ncbi:MFS transporter [Arcanobacterium hippocoleae]|uniref:MFS family permease n=1 Tax=Arcanobacterium hippocoleae TaxID=149017 RepID=A0ABU1T081_9ACTO|nr:MFS transporter [Arcanobacterium hippocoleae]MDR6938740.1 MFS family permease [Arcanobacterium hippocoleae]
MAFFSKHRSQVANSENANATAEPVNSGINRDKYPTTDVPSAPQETKYEVQKAVATNLCLWLKIISVSVISLVAFEVIAVATAMPFVVEELHGEHMYALASGIVLATQLITTVLAGPWCDARGPKPIFYTGITFFVLGLLFATAAMNIELLVLGRAIQGFGGGLIVVPLYVMIAKFVPPRSQPAFFAAFAAAWILPSLIGPMLAGLLVEHLSWRWVFGLPAVLVIFAIPLIMLKMRQFPNTHSTAKIAHLPRVITFATLAGVSVGALQIISGTKAADFTALTFLSIAVLTIVVFAAVRPLLPPHTFRVTPGLPATVFYRGLINGSYLTVELFLPLMLKNLHGYSPTAAGMVLTVGSITWAIGSWIQGRIFDPQLRAKLPVIASTLQLIGTLITFLGIFSEVSGIAVYIGWLIASFGIGLVYPALSAHALALTPAERHGQTSSAIQVSDTLGAAVLIAFGGIIFAFAEPAGFLAYLYALGFAGVIIVLGLCITGRIKMGKNEKVK